MKRILTALIFIGGMVVQSRAADITDPKAIIWDNVRARTLSDQIVILYNKLKAYQTDYASQAINAAIVADGASNNIGDGYTSDGRQAVTGTQIQNLKACIDQIVTALDTTNVTGVGTPPMTTVNQIQVNGSLR
jgi:hypothetical protein